MPVVAFGRLAVTVHAVGVHRGRTNLLQDRSRVLGGSRNDRQSKKAGKQSNQPEAQLCNHDILRCGT